MTGHQLQLDNLDPNYKESLYNVMVEWETGEITEEPLLIIAADDQVTCAAYAKKHNLLNLPGWKRFKNIAKNQKSFSSVYSTRHLSSAEDKNFPFCPQLRTQKMYGKQMLLSKLSTMAYLTMVVLPSWQLLTQYYTN